MARTTFITPEPVTLSGFQAIMRPSKFGYTLQAIVDEKLVRQLEVDRVDTLKWAESKLKNPKRSTLRPEPWEEVSDGLYKIKFAWKEEDDFKPPLVDTEGSPITDERTPIYEGSTVKLAFYQKPYILKDGVTYGTSLKLVGVQVKTVNSKAGVDTGDMSPENVAEMFGKTEGYKISDPNVTTHEMEEEDDF